MSGTWVSWDSSWMSTAVASGPGCWRAAYAGLPGWAPPTESCSGSGSVSDQSLPLPESQTTQCVPTAVTCADFEVKPSVVVTGLAKPAPSGRSTVMVPFSAERAWMLPSTPTASAALPPTLASGLACVCRASRLEIPVCGLHALRLEGAGRGVDQRDGAAAQVDDRGREDPVAGRGARLGQRHGLLGGEGAGHRVDRHDLVAGLGQAEHGGAVLQHVETRVVGRLVEDAEVELGGRLVDAAVAGLLGARDPDSAVVEVGLAHDLALAARGHPDQQAGDERDDDRRDDADPSLGGGGAHVLPCSAATTGVPATFSLSGVLVSRCVLVVLVVSTSS